MDVAISIIIPVYNVEKYLRECLDSVIAQSFTDWEAICVNDGATDDSLAILEEYAAKDNRFKVISQVNGGQGKARNTGIKQAKGKYIYFIDSDDWLATDALSVCYNTATKHDLDMVIFQYIPEMEQKDFNFINGDTSPYPPQICESVLTGTELFKHLVLNNFNWLPSVCLRFFNRCIFDRANLTFNEEIVYEDLFFSIQMDFLLKRVMCIQNKLYHYRIRANSTMTRKPRIIDFYSRCVIYKTMNSIFQKHFNENDLLFNQAMLIRISANISMAATTLKGLDKDEITQYVSSHPETNDFFILVSLELDKQEKHKNKLDAISKQNDSLQEKLDFVLHHSLSYKIGQVITWLPRKIKGIFKHD